MAATDSLRRQPRQGDEARPPTTAEIVAAEARAATETGAELEDLITAEIEVPLGPVAAKLAPLLERQLRRRAHEDVGLRRPRSLAADLEGWTEERLRPLFASMAAGTAATLGDGVLEIERAHRRRLEAELARLGPEPTPLVAVVREAPLHRLGSLEPAVAGSARRGLLLRASLPGPLGRQLVRAGAEARLRSALAGEAARLRAELAGLARDALDRYRRELRARLAELAR